MTKKNANLFGIVLIVGIVALMLGTVGGLFDFSVIEQFGENFISGDNVEVLTLDLSENPLANVEIRISGGSNPRTITTNAEGSSSLFLDPGSYVATPIYKGTSKGSQAFNVEMAGGQLVRITFKMAR